MTRAPQPVSAPATIVWLRHDLRLADQPALLAACARGRPLIVLYIAEPPGPWAPGAASRLWLHRSLAALATDLAEFGQRLLLKRGAASRVLGELIDHGVADAVYLNRDIEPAGAARDRILAATVGRRCRWREFDGRLIFRPEAITTANGAPFRVFTPYYRACLRTGVDTHATGRPRALPPPPAGVDSLSLASLGLEPSSDWAAGIRARWTSGERAAWVALDRFVDARLARYPLDRGVPGVEGTAALSPHLHFGEISARSAWAALDGAAVDAAGEAWRRQLVWREFAHHLLWHFPHTTDGPFQARFAAFDWHSDAALLARWQRGLTGIPLVDAGMRELWATGYMHNRVRMVVASFLCKHLGLHWLDGARWFWDTLVDADLANNTLGWQWTAGCGADAAPYFRVFNPLTQSRRFDPEGVYLRRWLPERAHLRGNAIHDPAVPAHGYPAPVVDLAAGRAAALARYAELSR